MLFMAGPDEPASFFTLHRAAVSQVLGQPGQTISIEKQHDVSDLAEKAVAGCRELAGQAGCSSSDVWIVLSPSAVRYAASLHEIDFAGLVLVMPEEAVTREIIESGALADLEKPMMMVAGQHNEAAALLFEQQTGEDAFLFPLDSKDRPSIHAIFQSVDGNCRLLAASGKPWLFGFEQFSPDIIADMITWPMYFADSSVSERSSFNQIRFFVLTTIYRVLMALLFLLLIPASVLAIRQAAFTDQPVVPDKPVWHESLFWLTASLLAILITALINRASAAALSWPAGLLLVAPAIHGWLHFGWQKLFAHENKQLSGQTVTLHRLLPSLLFSLLLIGLINLILSVFSLSAATTGRAYLLLAMTGAGISIGPLGSADWQHHQNRKGRLFFHWLKRRAIFWIMPLVLVITADASSAFTAVLISVWVLWTDWLGRSLQQFGRSDLLASLTESACLMSLLVPLVLKI